MNCQDIEKQLTSYLDGSLSNMDKHMISVHLNTCNLCHAKLDYLSNTLSYLDEIKVVTPSPFLYTRINARMQATPSTIFGFRFIPVRLAYILTLGLLAGTLFSRVTVQHINEPVSLYSMYDVFNEYRLEQIESMILLD